MGRFLSMILILVLCVSMAFASDASGGAVPSDAEVKVALQSVLVAAAASLAAQNLTPPVQFAESTFFADGTYSRFSLDMDRADVGYLRRVVLESPMPVARQMGFLEALLTSVVRIIPDHARLIAYLQPQALMEQEILLSGHVEAIRLSTPYPFRYEGNGSLDIEGSRFSEPFHMEIEFMIPLEGPSSPSLIPLIVQAGGQDFLHVAQALFPPLPPPVPTGQM